MARARQLVQAQTNQEAAAVGLFTVSDTAWLGTLGAAMMGAAAGMGAGTAGGPMMDKWVRWTEASRPRTKLPHRVVVAVLNDSMLILGGSRRAGFGQQIARWPASGFSASMQRFLFEVDLTVQPDGGGRVVLAAKRGPLHRTNVRTARAVVALARSPGA